MKYNIIFHLQYHLYKPLFDWNLSLLILGLLINFIFLINQ